MWPCAGVGGGDGGEQKRRGWRNTMDVIVSTGVCTTIKPYTIFTCRDALKRMGWTQTCHAY